MSVSLEVRDFRWPDIPSAAAIERESFPVGAWQPESFWNELANGPNRCVFLAAVIEGELVGYIDVMVDDEDAHLHSLNVAPKCRRQGVAKLLIEEALAQMRVRPCRRWLLEVSEHNAPAIALYRSLGFAELAVRTDYYGPRDSALVLVLELPTGDQAGGEDGE